MGGGGQIGVDERTKILECDRIMKAFLVERNKWEIIWKVKQVNGRGGGGASGNDLNLSEIL